MFSMTNIRFGAMAKRTAQTAQLTTVGYSIYDPVCAAEMERDLVERPNDFERNAGTRMGKEEDPGQSKDK